MSTRKYVSLDKLTTFLNNLKNTFALKNHTHTVDSTLSETSTNPVQNKVINEEFDAIAQALEIYESELDGKADAHDHPYLSNSTKYAGSSSVGGAANSANKVNITRPSNLLAAAAAMSGRTEEIYFFGSDGLSAGAPVNYCIINAKQGDNYRTILDCYSLLTGDHYINGNADARYQENWTGWILQPNATHNHDSAYDTKGAANTALSSAKTYTDNAVAQKSQVHILIWEDND